MEGSSSGPPELLERTLRGRENGGRVPFTSLYEVAAVRPQPVAHEAGGIPTVQWYREVF